MCTSDALFSDRVAGVLALCVVILGGCPGGGSPAPTTAGSTPAALPGSARAGRLFSSLCASCHGARGRAQTALAAELPVPPRDLTRCTYKLRTTPSGSLPTDCDLLRTLHVGLPGARMPGFGALLPRRDLLALVGWVKGLCPAFSEAKPETPITITAPPAFTGASARRGGAIYRKQGCGACHGPSGRGDGPAASSLTDSLHRPLPPRDFSQGVFRGGFGRADIYRAFSTGLNGTPMPAVSDDMDAPARWDLTHHIVSLSSRRSAILRYLEQPPRWYEPSITLDDLGASSSPRPDRCSRLRHLAVSGP